MRRSVCIEVLLLLTLCACGSSDGGSDPGNDAGSPPPNSPTRFFASPTGTGSACSRSLPCGLDAIREVIQSLNVGMTGDIVIELGGGTYWLNQPFALDQGDSGSDGYKVIFTARAGEVPVFRGGVSVSEWTLYDESAGIYQAPVNETGFRQLYVNGELATRARQPNMEDPDHFGPYLSGDFSVDTSTNVISIETSNLPAVSSNLNDVELVFMPHWYHNRVRIERMEISGPTTAIWPREPERSNIFNKTAGFYAVAFYYFENAYELLDQEGEWYFDPVSSVLYYKPRADQDMASAEVVIPVIESLLTISGTSDDPIHDIEIRGITFEMTAWEYPSNNGVGFTQGNQIIEDESLAFRTPTGAVSISRAHNIRLERNVFNNIGGVAIDLGAAVKDSEIVGNKLSNTMSNGIVLGSALMANPPESEQVSRISISNNVIERVGRQNTNAQGIFASFVKDVLIEHNEIRDFGYTAIQIGQQPFGNVDVGMSNNVIRYNHIHRVMNLHDDGGGIYTLARQPGTHIFENWVHDLDRSPWASIWPIAAIYQDNFSEFITVERNVLEDNSLDIYEQTGVGAQNNDYISNDITDQAIKDNAGLEPAFADIDPSFDSGEITPQGN